MALNIKTIVVLFLSASFLILGTTVLFEKYTDATSDSLIISRHTVIIDAGHGGFDGGAVASDGTVEKDINLNIALKLENFLKFCGYEVVMTRTDDNGTEDNGDSSISERKKSDLQNRLALMSENQDAIYVSVHLNKFTTSSASGAQVFYAPNFETARILGESIQHSVVNLIQPDNLRVIKKGTSSTYLLYNAKIPAVIVECGFLSNPQELEQLKKSDYQSKMAFSIAAGIVDFYSDGSKNEMEKN